MSFELNDSPFTYSSSSIVSTNDPLDFSPSFPAELAILGSLSGNSGKILTNDGASLSWISQGDLVINIVNDTTPQLGGNLDLNGKQIGAVDASDLTKLNQITSTATELNVLDGIPGTLTATELGYVDGVTSAIQTQLNSKAPIADPTFTGEIGIGAVNVSETELGILEGAILSTTELNYVDGVTSAIQTQLNAKSTASKTETLTNKTIDADGTGNTISNIEDANIKTGAAIDASKIADGSVSDAEFQRLDGVSEDIQDQLDDKADLEATIVSTSIAPTITSANNGNIYECSSTFTFTLPDDMPTGMQLTIVNVGTGTITLDAETTLQTKDSNTQMENQYGAVSAYHRGSDVWIAFGDLAPV